MHRLALAATILLIPAAAQAIDCSTTYTGQNDPAWWSYCLPTPSITLCRKAVYRQIGSTTEYRYAYESYECSDGSPVACTTGPANLVWSVWSGGDACICNTCPCTDCSYCDDQRYSSATYGSSTYDNRRILLSGPDVVGDYRHTGCAPGSLNGRWKCHWRECKGCACDKYIDAEQPAKSYSKCRCTKTPPPGDKDDETPAKCRSVGGSPYAGDPVHIPTGESYYSKDDFHLTKGFPFTFRRTYSSFGSSSGDSLNNWIGPYGAGELPDGGNTVLWTHNLHSFVIAGDAFQQEDKTWEVRAPGAGALFFLACTPGASGCWAEAHPSSIEGNAQLFHAPDASFILFEGDRRYVFSHRVMDPAGIDRSLLTSVEDAEYASSSVADNRVLLRLSYGKPSAPSVSPGTCHMDSSQDIFLRSVFTPASGTLSFHYKAATNSTRVNGKECVLDKITLDDNTSAPPRTLVSYTYEAGKAGKISKATYPGMSSLQAPTTDYEESYSYPATASGSFKVLAGGTTTVQHDIGSDSRVQKSWVNRGGILSPETRDYRLNTATNGSEYYSYIDDTMPAGDGTGSVKSQLKTVGVSEPSFASGPRVTGTNGFDEQPWIGGEGWGFVAQDGKRAANKFLFSAGASTRYVHALATTPSAISNLPSPPLELREIHKGEALLLPLDAGTRVAAFQYSYGPLTQNPRAYKQLLRRESRYSYSGPNGTNISHDTYYAYDAVTNHLTAIYRTGSTSDYSAGSWTTSASVPKVSATFFRRSPSAGCGGQGYQNTQIVETEGPCWVASTTATSCIPGQRVLLTTLEYDTNNVGPSGGMLLSSTRYPQYVTGAAQGSCGVGLRRTYSQYDAFGRPTLVADSATAPGSWTVQTSLSYNGAGQLVSATRQHLTWSYEYDGPELHSIRHPGGNYTVYCHRDPSSGSCDASSPFSPEVRALFESPNSDGSGYVAMKLLTWGADGRVKSVREFDASGERRRRTLDHDLKGAQSYERLGSQLSAITAMRTGPDGLIALGPAHQLPPLNCSRWQESPNAWPVSAVGCTEFKYDSRGYFRDLQLPDHNQLCLEHDDSGNLTHVWPNRVSGTPTCLGGFSSSDLYYTYDGFGNVISASGWSGLAGKPAWGVHFAYDAAGNVIARQSDEMAGQSTSLEFAYDGLGRILSVVQRAAVATQLFSFAYDVSATASSAPPRCGLATGYAGKPSFKVDSSGRTDYAYDYHGRITHEWKRRPGSSGCDSVSSYSYSPNGELTFRRHTPNTLDPASGRGVGYAYRSYPSGASTGQLERIGVEVFSGSPGAVVPMLQDVIINIEQEPWGAVRGYDVVNSLGQTAHIEYKAGNTSASPPDSCSASPEQSDLTGRYRLLEVTRESGSVFKQWVAFRGDQPVGQSECLLNDPAPRQLQFTLDNGGTNAALASETGSGATSRSSTSYVRIATPYGPQFNERAKRTTSLPLAVAGSPSVQEQQLLFDAGVMLSGSGSYYPLGSVLPGGAPFPPGAPPVTTSSSWMWWQTYDRDGRVTAANGFPGVTVGKKFTPATAASGVPGTGLESVVKAVQTSAGTYHYFYDAFNRRWAKVYPINGVRDEFYYSPGSAGLELEIGPDDVSPSHLVTEDYIAIGDQVLAVIRGKLSPTYQRLPDGSPVCDRLSNAAWRKGDAMAPGSSLRACGTFFTVADFLLRPVLVLDDSMKVAGTGEYEAFGHVNKVEVLGGYQPWPVPFPADGGWPGWPDPMPETSVLRVNAPRWAASSTRVRMRVHYADVDVPAQTPTGSRVFDEANPSCSATPAPEYCGAQVQSACFPGASCGPNLGETTTGWFHALPFLPDGGLAFVNVTGSVTPGGSSSCRGHRVNGAPSRCRGALVDSIEYRRYEVGAKAWWPSLRLPGQYADEESGLFENWNRYYDATTGRYLSPEPLLQSPRYVEAMAQRGHVLPVYGYALNNPLAYSDFSGLKVKKVRLEVEGPVDVDKTVNGMPGATTFDNEHLTSGCRPRPNGTYGFDVDIEARIRTEIEAGMGDKPSADEPGLTVKQHERNHAQDFKDGCSSQKLNKNLRTEGFKDPEACVAARKEFASALSRYFDKVEKNTRRRDR